VWYLSYRISLVCKGAGTDPGGATWSARMEEVTNSAVRRVAKRKRVYGQAIPLGIRSEGANLNMAVLPPPNDPRTGFPTQEYFDRLNRFANWIVGAPYDESQSAQEQEAALGRAMEQSQSAQRRYDFVADWGAPGNLVHKVESGSAPVICLGDFVFEIDVEKRTFKLKLASGFTDTEESTTAVTGEVITEVEGETTRMPIETNLAGGAYEILSIDPKLEFIEGPLPGAFGPIFGRPAYRVVVRKDTAAGVRELKGTLMVQFSLSPTPPIPAELLIIPANKYASWRPIGGNDERTAGEFMPIKVKLQKVGGGDPQFKVERFIFRLVNTSHEKGVCMNWPPRPEAQTPFDLQFEQGRDPGVDVVGGDGQMAEQVWSKMTDGLVTVSCFDYGAWGEFEALAELENGEVVEGVVQGTGEGRLRIPARKPGSLIASEFMKHLGNLKDDDDSEDDPKGDAFKGDGLTLYEEYRGFKVGGTWKPGDPKKKDVFVLNQMPSGQPHALTERGITVFETATGLVVHRLKDDEVNSQMVINFNRTQGPHLSEDQHVIPIKAGMELSKGGAYEAGPSATGTPGTANALVMPPDWPEYSDLGGTRRPYFEKVLAHELLHCCNVYHHGEADYEAVWRVVNQGGVEPWFEEIGPAFNGRIHLKKEDGTTVTARDYLALDNKPPVHGYELGDVRIGVQHGQHSGDDQCLIRYANAMACVKPAEPDVRYVLLFDLAGAGLCSSPDATGVNAPPKSRYGEAATRRNRAVGAHPFVTNDRGNCKGQIRVNDLGPEPRR